MLRNYLKIAFRNLRRQKGYAFINIAGLAVGLTCCILIALYVQRELSYDEFHANADRTYRVLREFDIPDLHATIPGTPSLLAPALEQSVLAVEAAVRIWHRSPVVQHGQQEFVEPGFIWADPGFFEVFSFPVLRGEAALGRPGTVVLTEETATKYFPDENPIGQTLRVGDYTLEVTGVMANVPANSHLQFDFVGSLKTTDPRQTWGLNNWLTYVLLAEGYSKDEVMPSIEEVIRPHAIRRLENVGITGNGFIPHLQPITGIHLGQGVSVDLAMDFAPRGNILYVYLFVALAAFVLLLACINFMNLSTARSMERAQEVGMRKALGAVRGQLAGQFLGEAVLMSLLALALALLLSRGALPLLNALAGTELAFGDIFTGPQVLLLIGLSVGTGLLAGSYPALALSRFQPAQVLRGIGGAKGGSWLRKGLVVFQFAISIALIAGTMIVFNQLSFMRSTGLGFNKENLVLIENARYLGNQVETFKQELEKLPGVQSVASGFSMPSTRFINSMWRPANPEAEDQNMYYSYVGFDYVKTLDIEMAAGRGFSRALASDSFAVVLNKAAAQDFSWTPEEALGKKITRGSNRREFTVIGVTENFHYQSLHKEVYPLALFGPLQTQRLVAIRVQPDNIAGTLEAIGSTWEQFSELPFNYSFLADDLAAQYRAEQRLARVFGLFTGLAILIACLGLFGLAAYMAERRTKEIGVRKVLGASVPNIVALLSKDFLKLVGIAIVIAIPIAYFAMNRWLQDFAYRIELGAGVFVLAGLIAILVAFLTVSYQSIKAALANPADSLRYE